MAAGCSHVKQLHLASDKSFLNPRTWACVECGFTDSVWACLLCNNVSCGRDNSRHAFRHFEQTKHPIAVEVNKRYVFCYLCDDYVLADDLSGDIALVQSLLAQVASQNYSESCSRSGHVIRPAQTCFTRSESRIEAAIDCAADKRYTALCHWRCSQLARAFNTWRSYVTRINLEVMDTPTKLEAVDTPTRSKRRRKKLVPGMTGFRNLGNTCYMNAVLQSLGHLVLFRECFRQLLPETTPSMLLPETTPSTLPHPKTPPTLSCTQTPPHHVAFNRQTTIECFQHINTRPPRLLRGCGWEGRGGLSGGRGGRKTAKNISKTTSTKTQLSDANNPSLSVEMHALMRVMWSGKWAVVTPHAVLNTVWKVIPSFHGYTQQDAQEFLCELLLVLQNECEQWPPIPLFPSPLSQPFLPHQLLPSLFQGQLLSKVVYKGCSHCSSIQEPFWDISLDFQEKSHGSGDLVLQDMLSHFTSSEPLEGKSYSCGTCNHSNKQHAYKQLQIAEYPEILRLHLKRFHWSRHARHKINTHVRFPFQLDIRPYMVSSYKTPSTVVYHLSSIIIHHGAGFQSGHYTSYCWNPEAESWVHCNDARISRCLNEDVFNSQAYILFYTHIKSDSLTEDILLEEEEPPSPKKRRTAN